MSDALADGCRIYVLNVTDDFTGECVAGVVAVSTESRCVSRRLGRNDDPCGNPCVAASNNGTELTSNAALKWQESHSSGCNTLRMVS